MNNNVTKLVIDRKRWLHGKDEWMGEGSMLLRPRDKKMCCLGFLCLAMGEAPEKIELKSFPTKHDFPALPDWLTLSVRLTDTDTGNDLNAFKYRASKINDTEFLTDEEREARLIALFAEKGISLEFVD